MPIADFLPRGDTGRVLGNRGGVDGWIRTGAFRNLRDNECSTSLAASGPINMVIDVPVPAPAARLIPEEADGLRRAAPRIRSRHVRHGRGGGLISVVWDH